MVPVYNGNAFGTTGESPPARPPGRAEGGHDSRGQRTAPRMHRHTDRKFARWSPRPAEWDKCNVCGERFPNWPELRDHKRNHTPEEIRQSLRLQPKPGGPKDP